MRNRCFSWLASIKEANASPDRLMQFAFAPMLIIAAAVANEISREFGSAGTIAPSIGNKTVSSLGCRPVNPLLTQE